MSNVSVVLPSEVQGLLNSTMSTPDTREQVYQQAENTGQINPGSVIRFNIPAQDVADFRDSYVQVQLTMTNPVASVNERFEYLATNVLGNQEAAATAYFQLEFMGWTTAGNFTQASTNVQIQSALNALPSVINNGLVGHLIVTNTLSVDGALNIVNNSPNFNINSMNYRMINVVGWFGTNGANTHILEIRQNINTIGSIQYPILEYGIGSIIDRITVEINSETFIDITQYFLLWQMYSRLKLVDSRRTSGIVLYNEGQEKDFIFTGAKKFAIPLFGVGILDNIFPLGLVPGIQFRITIYLAQPTIALTTNVNGSTSSYYVQDCRFYYHNMKYGNDVLNALSRQLTSSQGITYGFVNWSNYNTNITGNTSQLVLNFNLKRFLGVCAVMRQNNFFNDNTELYKNSSFIKNMISNYRLKVGSNYFPKDKVELTNVNDDVVEAWIEVARFFGIFRPLSLDPSINDEALADLNYAADYHNEILYETNGQPDLPSFIMAISTDSTSYDNADMERHDYPRGIDTSGQLNVTLELNNYTLLSDNTASVFGKFLGMCILRTSAAIYDK